MSAAMDETGCVVVGAGVVGISVARALARAGRDVVLLEAEGAVGTGVSARSSEVVHAGFYYPEGSLRARLCVAGRRELYAFCDANAVAYAKPGKLVVAQDEAQRGALEALWKRGEANGVEGLRMLAGREVRALEPALRARAALLSRETGIVDSHGFVRALKADAVAHGAVVALGARVVGGCAEPRRVELHLADGGGVRCEALVNAAGLGAVALARALGGPCARGAPSLWPVRGSYFALRGRAPFARLIYPVPDAGGLGIHLTLDLAGRARFGPDAEPLDPGASLDYRVDPARAGAFEAAVRRYWPGLPDGALEPAFAGIRPRISAPGEALSDFVVHGPAEHGVPGVVHLFGIESPGLTAALALGDYVAQRLGAVER